MQQNDILTKLVGKLKGKPIIWEFEQDDDGAFKARLIMPNVEDVFEGVGENNDLAKLDAAQKCLDWIKIIQIGIKKITKKKKLMPFILVFVHFLFHLARKEGICN